MQSCESFGLVQGCSQCALTASRSVRPLLWRWVKMRPSSWFTSRAISSAMFAEEKPLLLPLPLEVFRYYQYGERTVHLDGCMNVMRWPEFRWPDFG